MSFTNNIDTHATKFATILSGKYSKKKKAIKTASKRVIQKTAETNGHLTGNKIADKTLQKNYIQKQMKLKWKY